MENLLTKFDYTFGLMQYKISASEAESLNKCVRLQSMCV